MKKIIYWLTAPLLKIILLPAKALRRQDKRAYSFNLCGFASWRETIVFQSHYFKKIIAIAMMSSSLNCIAQVADFSPKLNYIYPSGGQRGTTVDVVVCCQSVNENSTAVFSDSRITSKFIEIYDRIAPPGEEKRRATVTLIKLWDAGRQIPDDVIEQLPNRPLFDVFRYGERPATEDDIRRIKYEYQSQRQRQKPGITMTKDSLFRITIPEDAPLGRHEFRVQNQGGRSRPLYFYVSDTKETQEVEPVSDAIDAPSDKIYSVPTIINGQIYPGDLDVFRFGAIKGQKLKIHAIARELAPFIADGVPGWFEALITLYGPDGREITYSDSTEFRPDPTIVFTAQTTGTYSIHLRDSIYRGRRDFVYRLSIDKYMKEKRPDFPYVLEKAEDVNRHPFKVRKGQKVAIKTIARAKGSPIDTFLQIVDQNGDVLATNDDAETPLKIGIQTSYTDSFIIFTAPKAGTYEVHVSDTAQKGGAEYGYELHITKPQPDFDVYMTPSVVQIAPNQRIAVTFHAMRKDGYTGPINIEPDSNHKQYELEGVVIPAGESSITGALVSYGNSFKAVSLALTATGKAGRKHISSPVIPADSWQQAFIYHHLVPTDEIQIIPTTGRGRRLTIDIELHKKSPITLKKKRKVTVKADIYSQMLQMDTKDLSFRLVNGPKGVSLTKTNISNGVISLTFIADEKLSSRGNLIVEVALKKTIQRREKTRDIQFSLGILPPIAYTL